MPEGSACQACLMSAKEREAAGRRITDFLRDSEEYQLAEKILVYASYRDEVPTYDLMEGALRRANRFSARKLKARREPEQCLFTGLWIRRSFRTAFRESRSLWYCREGIMRREKIPGI